MTGECARAAWMDGQCVQILWLVEEGIPLSCQQACDTLLDVAEKLCSDRLSGMCHEPEAVIAQVMPLAMWMRPKPTDGCCS